MTKIVVVVEAGRVQNVYSNSIDVDVEVIDLDSDVPEVCEEQRSLEQDIRRIIGQGTLVEVY